MFELTDRKWILTDGGALSIREVLRRAHEIRTVCDCYVPNDVAVLRLLTVIVRRALRGPSNDKEWSALWMRGQFPEKAIEKYLADWKEQFDLFGKGRFYQQDISKTDEPKPATYLAPALPSDTNISHFRHGQDASSGLCPRCAGKGLLQLASFATAGGRGYSAGINDIPPVYFIVKGDNLFQTLLLNLIPEPWNENDKPVWEGKSKPLGQIGMCEGFTWQPRTIRLNEPAPGACSLCGDDKDGVIRRMAYSAGRSRSKERERGWSDPNVAFTDVKKRAALRPPNPQAYPASFAAFWRKQALVLLDALGEKGLQPPALIRVRELLRDGTVVSPVRIDAVALHTDGKAKFFAATRREWPLTRAILMDPALRETGLHVLELLESWISQQSYLDPVPAGQSGAAILKARFSFKRAEGEADAENVFRSWMEKPEMSAEDLSAAFHSKTDESFGTKDFQKIYDSCYAFMDDLNALDASVLSIFRRAQSGTPTAYPLAFEKFTERYWPIRTRFNNLSREACWLATILYSLNTSKGKFPETDLATSVKRVLPLNDAARGRLIQRWDAALKCDLSELRYHLPFFIRQLHSRGIPIHWPRLLHDFIDWKKPGKPIQVRWRQNGPSINRFQNFKSPQFKESKNARGNPCATEPQSVESES